MCYSFCFVMYSENGIESSRDAVVTIHYIINSHYNGKCGFLLYYASIMLYAFSFYYAHIYAGIIGQGLMHIHFGIDSLLLWWANVVNGLNWIA